MYEGKVIKEEGFMKYLKEFKKLKESKNIYLNKGDEILIDEVKINERYTTPLKHYIDDILLKSMENVGRVEVVSERKCKHVIIVNKVNMICINKEFKGFQKNKLSMYYLERIINHSNLCK